MEARQPVRRRADNLPDVGPDNLPDVGPDNLPDVGPDKLPDVGPDNPDNLPGVGGVWWPRASPSPNSGLDVRARILFSGRKIFNSGHEM